VWIIAGIRRARRRVPHAREKAYVVAGAGAGAALCSSNWPKRPVGEPESAAGLL